MFAMRRNTQALGLLGLLSTIFNFGGRESFKEYQQYQKMSQGTGPAPKGGRGSGSWSHVPGNTEMEARLRLASRNVMAGHTPQAERSDRPYIEVGLGGRRTDRRKARNAQIAMFEKQTGLRIHRGTRNPL